MPSPWSFKGPSHPEEEGKLINISIGYEVLPLCMGPAELCINISRQTWAFILPPKKGFLDTAKIIYFPFFVSEPCLYY